MIRKRKERTHTQASVTHPGYVVSRKLYKDKEMVTTMHFLVFFLRKDGHARAEKKMSSDLHFQVWQRFYCLFINKILLLLMMTMLVTQW